MARTAARSLTARKKLPMQFMRLVEARDLPVGPTPKDCEEARHMFQTAEPGSRAEMMIINAWIRLADSPEKIEELLAIVEKGGQLEVLLNQKLSKLTH